MGGESRMDQLARDLEYIKAAVERNRPLLREIFSAPNFRSLSLLLGFFVAGLSVAFQVTIGRFGSFAVSPAWARALLLSLVGAGFLGVTVMKAVAVRRSLKRVDARLGYGAVFRELFLASLLHVFVPVLASGIAVVVFLALRGFGHLIVGAVGVLIGVLLNILGANLRTASYFAAGYWAMGTGAMSLFLGAIPGALWSALCFGGTCFAFALAAALQKGPEGSNGKSGE
jgi:hypothetical protein